MPPPTTTTVRLALPHELLLRPTRLPFSRVATDGSTAGDSLRLECGDGVKSDLSVLRSF